MPETLFLVVSSSTVIHFLKRETSAYVRPRNLVRHLVRIGPQYYKDNIRRNNKVKQLRLMVKKKTNIWLDHIQIYIYTIHDSIAMNNNIWYPPANFVLMESFHLMETMYPAIYRFVA